MTYCMADLHGRYREYRQMLERLRLGDGDRLYLLGDCVDRGPHGIPILLDIASRSNAVLLLGNHERTAALLLPFLCDGGATGLTAWQTDALRQVAGLWLADGGRPTLEGYRSLGLAERRRVMELLGRSRCSALLTVGGQTYHLSHTLPRRVTRLCDCGELDLTDGEADYSVAYDPAVITVTGHTPTDRIDPRSVGRIWQSNRHIALDCGAAYGHSLGCICLETGETYYVETGGRL